MSTRTFTLTEARALLPEVQERTARIVQTRADLAELAAALRADEESSLGGVAEAKALEAQLHEDIAWFTSAGLEVKGWAPVLVDFPSSLADRPVLLCWLEGEQELGWYHRPELGFAGRRRLT